MANGNTYGINFPFRDSFDGKYLDLSQTNEEEIRSSLIHLLLTRKGTRYYLPDFGTRLYEYIFEPLDGPTFNDIQSEIKDSVSKYIPNLIVNSITVTDASLDETNSNRTTIGNNEIKTYSIPGRAEQEYTAKVRIDYTITDSAFASSDFIIINI
jgi:phage baseplate assembly protein W